MIYYQLQQYILCSRFKYGKISIHQYEDSTRTDNAIRQKVRFIGCQLLSRLRGNANCKEYL